MKRMLLLMFLAGCGGHPLISITPPSNEIWKDDITRRLGLVEMNKADANLVGRAMDGQQKQIDELRAKLPTPTPAPTPKN